MTLSELVLEIAEQMEKDVKELKDEDGSQAMANLRDVLNYAKQLRIAVKASGKDAPAAAVPTMAPEAFHAQMVDKARAEFRNKEGELGKIIKEESTPQIFEVFDGPHKGDMLPMPANMPDKAFTLIGAEKYQLRDGKLRHVGQNVEV
jgi:hypothetical protein